MDIFRSKEIYRKIKKREEGEIKDPIVAIRGLYVVGDHMYPVYDNSCVTINEVKTKHPKIVDFTSISADVSSDHITRLIGMNIDNSPPTITRYSVDNQSQHDHITRLIGMSINKDVSLLRYTRDYQDTTDHITRLIGMNITNTQPTLIRYYHKPLLCQPEPMLMITAVNVNHCTITDGDISY